MSHGPVAIKGHRPLTGEVDKVVHQNHIPGSNFFLKGTHCRDGKNAGHAERLESGKVGPVVDLGRKIPVSFPVAGQENNRESPDLSDQIRVG